MYIDFKLDFPDQITWRFFNFTRWLFAIKQTSSSIFLKNLWAFFTILIMPVFIVADIIIFEIEWLIIKPIYFTIKGIIYLTKKTFNFIKNSKIVLFLKIFSMWLFVLISLGFLENKKG